MWLRYILDVQEDNLIDLQYDLNPITAGVTVLQAHFSYVVDDYDGGEALTTKALYDEVKQFIEHLNDMAEDDGEDGRIEMEDAHDHYADHVVYRARLFFYDENKLQSIELTAEIYKAVKEVIRKVVENRRTA